MKVSDLTIAQYYKFEQYIADNDIYAIFDLFGVDVSDMKISDMNTKFAEISSLSITKRQLSKYYYIKGTKYKAMLNLNKIKAGQFLDFQNYMAGDHKLEQILSIFLIPMKKTFFGWKSRKYGDDYDVVKVQEEIRDYFLIEDAITLSDFFLNLSIHLSKVMKASLVRKLGKMMKKQQKNQQH